MYEDDNDYPEDQWYKEILEARRDAFWRRQQERLEYEAEYEPDYSEDCIDQIRDSIPKDERIKLARSFGKNWACIISGMGDQ